MLKKLGIFLIAVSLCLTLGYSQAMATAEDAPGGIGDLLLFPIYDVTETDERVGIPWENYFVIQNTSNSWVACHLRFRAGTKSIEVYDHILLLSPYDVFFADMMRTSGGGVTITSSDTETLRNSGIITGAATTWSTEFSTELLEDCGYGDDLTETERGYIEVIGLWTLSGTDSDSSDIADITSDTYDDPNDPAAKNVYDILYSVWGGAVDGNRPTPLSNTSKGQTLEDCPNVITGSMEMGDAVTGMYQLENFVALNSFRTDGVTADHRDGLAEGEIVYPVGLLIPGGRCYTTSTTAYYLNPDWATTIGPTLRDGDDADKTAVLFSSEWSLNEVEAALAKSQIWAYYLNDAFSAEIDTDVVLTLPTKHHHFLFTTFGEPQYIAASWPYWDGTPPICGIYWQGINDFRAKIKGEMDSIDNGPIFIEGKIWDTDENSMGLSPAPSPSPWTVPTLEHEANVVRVGDEGILDTDYTHGQFQLTDWVLAYGEHTFSNGTCQLPIIGMTIRTHHVAGAAAWRSSMTRLQYK